MKLSFKNISFDSEEYWSAVGLRYKILRKPLNLEFSKKDLEQEHNQFHFICMFDKIIVGTFIFVKKDATKLKMRQVCVHKDFQKQNIGLKMMLFAEKWAKENNFKTIFCHARDNALLFYSKLNYKTEGESFEEVGLKHFKLSKDI